MLIVFLLASSFNRRILGFRSIIPGVLVKAGGHSVQVNDGSAKYPPTFNCCLLLSLFRGGVGVDRVT